MNRDPYIPFRPFRREEGVFVRIDENGDQLRLHHDEGTKRWHVHRWREDPTSPDGWRGPVVFGFTVEDMVAMGGAAMALPVSAEAPLARAAGGAQDGRDDGGT